MNRRILKLFDIRASEASKALWFFLLMLLISTFYTLASTVGDTLFITAVGEERLDDLLPWYYVGVALATISVTWIVDWFLDRSQKVRLFLILETLFALSVLGLRWGLELVQEEWFYFAIMVWLEVIGLVSLTIFFSFMGDFFTSRDARRLYGFINGGYPLGNLLMGFGVQPMLLFVRPEDLLQVCALLLVGVAAVPFYINRSQNTVVDREQQRELTGSAPLSKVVTHPFVAIIFLMIVADLLYFVFTDFELKVFASEGRSAEELASFFGLLYGVIGVIQIVVQFALSSLLLKKVGILNSLLINASLAVIAILAFIAHPSLALIAIANIARYTFSETLDIPARELLYFPLAGRLRERAQTFANGILAPLAQGLGGLMLVALVPLLHNVVHIGYIATFFALVWLSSIFLLMPRYQKSLEESLVNWDFNPENIDRLLEQRKSRDIFSRLMVEKRYAEIIALLDFVPDHTELDFREDFYSLLTANDVATRIKVLELIRDRPQGIDVDRIRPLLDDEHEDVAATAVEVVAVLLGAAALPVLLPYFDSEKTDVRVAAKASLAMHGGLDAALMLFPRLKEEMQGALNTRVEVVKVITRMRYPGAAQVLRGMLDGAEVRLKREILGALSRLRDPSIVPDLLPMILIPSLEENVTIAMERMPPEAAIHIVNFVQGTPLDTLHRVRMIRLLSKFPHEAAGAFLTKNYQEESVPIQRVNCLIALQAIDGKNDFEADSGWVENEIDWALTNFDETTRALGACRKADVRFQELLLDHYRYQLEVLFGLLNLYYREEGLERAGEQFFSPDKSQQANALELFDMNLARTHQAMIMPVLSYFLEPAEIEGFTLSQLWRKELPGDPFLRMIRTYYLFAKAPPEARKVESENKNVLGVLSIVSFLKKVDLFSEIPANYLIPIAEMMKHRTAFAGETLFEKGDTGDSLYVIQKGTIEIVIDANRTIALKTGEAIGDMALIDGEPRSATARVYEDSRLLQLRSYDFNRLLLSYPIIAKSLLRILSKRLRMANTRR